MTLTVYHLKTCDTCRKAIKALNAAGHTVDLVDVRADGVPRPVLQNIADVVGWKTLLNTRSTTWRGLDASDKDNISADKAVDLLAQYPTLIKRPVIVQGTDITVGWTQDVQAKYL